MLLRLLTSSICFFSILSLGLTFTPLASAQNFTRKINLGWEEIPGAVSYEFEITRLYPLSPPFKTLIKVKKTTYEMQLEPGRYQMRTRSVEKNGTKGAFSEAVEFVIKFPAIKTIYPAPGQEVTPTGTSKNAPVEFQWEPDKNFDFYEWTVYSPKGKKLASKKTKNSRIKVNLVVNRSYKWTLTGFAEGQQYTEAQKKPELKFSISGFQLTGPRSIKLVGDPVRGIQWKRVRQAQKYNIVISKKKKKGEWDPLLKKNTRRSSFLFRNRFPVGEYKVDVRSMAKGSDRSKASTIFFKIGKKKKTIIKKVVAPSPPGQKDFVPTGPVEALDHWNLGLGASILQIEEVTPVLDEKGKAFSLGGSLLISGLPQFGKSNFFGEVSFDLQTYKINNEAEIFYRGLLGGGYMIDMGRFNIYLSMGYFSWQFPQVNSPSTNIVDVNGSVLTNPSMAGPYFGGRFESALGSKWSIGALAYYHGASVTTGAFGDAELSLGAVLDLGVETLVQWSKNSRVYFRISRQSIVADKTSTIYFVDETATLQETTGDSEFDSENWQLSFGLSYKF